MFLPEQHLRVFVYGQPTDMRKSFRGLRALTQRELGEDPLSGAIFVFINRRGNYLKALYFDRSGFYIWSKRLQQGCFARNPQGVCKREIDYTRLKLLLEGIDVKQVKQRRRFSQEKRA